MKAIETMGTIVNETSILLDMPVLVKGKIKVLLLFEETEEQVIFLPSVDRLLRFVGKISQSDLIQMKRIIGEDCSRIDNEW
jgi:hypothetical protein